MSSFNRTKIFLREKSAFADSIHNMIQTGEMSDLTITLKITTTSGEKKDKIYNAHKSIMSANSGYFRTLFAGGRFKEAVTGNVELEGYEVSTFNKVMQFMYNGNYKQDDSVLTDAKIFMAADYFDIPNLKSVCIQRIAWKTDLRLDGGPPYKLEHHMGEELLKALSMICSTGKLEVDPEAARHLSLNLARRAHELRQRPEFEEILIDNPGIGVLLFKGCLELSCGRAYTTGQRTTIELFCQKCQVLTKSIWRCPGMVYSCGKGDWPAKGEFGQNLNGRGVCEECKYAYRVYCDVCKAPRYPYSNYQRPDVFVNHLQFLLRNE